MRYDGAALTDIVESTNELRQSGVSIDRPSSFGVGANGEVCVCDYDGEIYRLVPAERPKVR